VEKYKTGALGMVDTNMMAYMSGAVEPYLIDLEKNAPDSEVRASATAALYIRRDNAAMNAKETSWRNWNLQSGLLTKEDHPDTGDSLYLYD
jgi:hypothetical protein